MCPAQHVINDALLGTERLVLDLLGNRPCHRTEPALPRGHNLAGRRVLHLVRDVRIVVLEDQLASDPRCDPVGVAEPEVRDDLKPGDDAILAIDGHLAIVEVRHLVAVGPNGRAGEADDGMCEAAALAHGLAPHVALAGLFVVGAVMRFIEDERETQVLAEQREILDHALKRLVVDDDAVVVLRDAIEIGRHPDINAEVRLAELVLRRIGQRDNLAVVLDPLLDRLARREPDDVVY